MTLVSAGHKRKDQPTSETDRTVVSAGSVTPPKSPRTDKHAWGRTWESVRDVMQEITFLEAGDDKDYPEEPKTYFLSTVDQTDPDQALTGKDNVPVLAKFSAETATQMEKEWDDAGSAHRRGDARAVWHGCKGPGLYYLPIVKFHHSTFDSEPPVLASKHCTLCLYNALKMVQDSQENPKGRAEFAYIYDSETHSLLCESPAWLQAWVTKLIPREEILNDERSARLDPMVPETVLSPPRRGSAVYCID